MRFSVQKVMCLGSPVGNLWDVMYLGQQLARVTYHGNQLVVIKGSLTNMSKSEVEKAIEDMYAKD